MATGNQTRVMGAVAVVALGAIGMIIWTVSQKKAASMERASDELVDSVAMRVVENALLPQLRRAIGARCAEHLPTPVTEELLLRCETSETAITLSHVELTRGVDGGVAPELAACVTEAAAGLNQETTHVFDPRSDAGVKLKIPAGRAYELVVVLELGRVDLQGYLP